MGTLLNHIARDRRVRCPYPGVVLREFKTAAVLEACEWLQSLSITYLKVHGALLYEQLYKHEVDASHVPLLVF